MSDHTIAFRTIKVEEIDASIDPFQPIRPRDVDHSLLRSIDQFGILSPLLILLDSGKYWCLSGVNRLRACRILGLDTVPCRVIGEEVPVKRRLELMYLSGLEHGKPTVIEDGYLLDFARQRVTDDELRKLAGLMGYKTSRHSLERIFSLLTLEPDTILAIHQGELTEKTGRKLLATPPEEQRLLTRLIRRFKYGSSKQQRLVELALELSKRKECAFSCIYDDWQRNVAVTDQKNIPQQGAALLDHLQALYAPRSRQAEEEFRQAVQRLHLPPGMNIQHSQAFERDEVTLTITFPSQRDLEQRIEDIKRAAACTDQTKG